MCVMSIMFLSATNYDVELLVEFIIQLIPNLFVKVPGRPWVSQTGSASQKVVKGQLTTHDMLEALWGPGGKSCILVFCSYPKLNPF